MTCTGPRCSAPRVPGRKMCAGHAAYHRVQSALRRRERGAARCHWIGCGREPAAGRKHCRQHLDYFAAHYRARREKAV